jgi:phenylalanyl-tRNA synthetase alpha chain
MNDLADLVLRARAEFAQCADPAALENAKARYLGKSGAITERMKGLGKLAASERPAAGARINEAKAALG